VNAVATAWDAVPVVILVQRRGMPVAVMAAAPGVCGWHQVTDFDNFLRFFLGHFILLSGWFGLS
jgi:hypothetical protein